MRNRERLIILVLVLLLTISVGYATLMTTITINGTTTVRANSWNVYIESVANVLANGSASVTTNPSVVSGDTTTTSLTYDVALNQPGDSYEFEFTVKNAGTMDIILSKLPTLSGLGVDQDAYINHTLTNDDDSAVTVENSVITAGGSKTYKVKVEYDADIESSELPSTNQSLNLSAELEYVQR